MTIVPTPPLRIRELEPQRYPAGVGVWGALPAIYDTTAFEPEHGVHVHARAIPGRKKDIDASYDVVNVVLPSGTLTLREAEATAYVAAAVLGLSLHLITCPYCSALHLDEDRFAVHPHQRHRCSNCNEEFLLSERAIGNPIVIAKQALGDELIARPTDPGKPPVRIDQAADYCNAGILIWGSNPAILWTAPRNEQAGIHVHAFTAGIELPTIDDTYERVEIDGVTIDAAMVRIFMIQQSLPYLRKALAHVKCNGCGTSHFDDTAPFAVEPHRNHRCAVCDDNMTTTSPVVSNPLIDVLPMLYANALRSGRPKNPLSA